ncbi:MAG: sulfite exporter TauE/SafE family protein [Gammaproteobacteria bacterium]|nr:sulfite exporter TauE/SafE family protein [Gammaproteobacteria bacterium]
MTFFQYPLAGLLVGILVGATGVGGGALMTPLLVLLLGVAPHTAVGTDLLYASLTKLFGVGLHSAKGNVDWQVVRRLATGSLPAAAATLLWMHVTESNGIREGMVITGLAVALLLTSLAMAGKPWLNRIGRSVRINEPIPFLKFQPPLTVLTGVCLGSLVTLTSIGAGALGSVILVFLYPLRLTPVKLVGTDLAHAIPLALVAGAGHILLGNVDFVLLGTLLLGSIPGVLLGAHFGGKLPEQVLRLTIALMLALIGFKMLMH